MRGTSSGTKLGFFSATAEGLLLGADGGVAALLDMPDPVGRSLGELLFSDGARFETWLSELGPDSSRCERLWVDERGLRWLELHARRTERGIEGVLLDVSEQRDIAERYRLLVDGSPFGIVIIQDGVVVYSNAAQEAMLPSLGRRADALIEQQLHPEDLELVRRRVRDREAGLDVPGSYRYRILRDGEVRWIHIWSSRVTYRGRPAVQALGIDVTEEVRAMERARGLEVALDQARRLEAIGRLAGRVAHDFNNLLTVILTSAEIAALDGGGEDVQRIIEASIRARDLVNQLLTVGRRSPHSPRLVDLTRLVGRMEVLLRGLVPERVSLRVRGAAEELPVWVDPAELEMVLTNLVVNAVDAMPGAGELRVLSRRERVPDRGGAEGGDYAVLEVCDTGEGIAPEALPHLFEPFFTTKAEGQGTGLGLAMAHAVVERAGGFIRAISEPGETCLQVFLPLRAGAADAPAERERPRRIRLSGRVLLVDDDPLVRRALERVLRHSGLDVVTAGDGREALALLDGGLDVDVILSDVVMPNLNGLELRAAIRELGNERPVLLMTGYAEASVLPPEDAEQVLRKPLAPRDVLEVLGALLGG